MNPRSPVCERAVLEEELWVEAEVRKAAFDETQPLANQVNARSSLASSRHKSALYAFALGLPLDQVLHEVESAIDDIRRCVDFVRAQPEPDWAAAFTPYAMSAENGVRGAVGMVCLTACLMPDVRALERVVSWVAPVRRGQVLDHLVPAFVPSHGWPAALVPNTAEGAWANSLMKALAAPASGRASALAAYLDTWVATMKPLGLVMPPKQRRDRRYADFAFEAALVVCAYDIDDTSFRDHPFYPRDLVANYRAHLRHTRDSWRGEGAGAGVPLAMPQSGRDRADLAKSKHKAIARWLELAVGGDLSALAAVLAAVGKPRKLPDIGAVMSALAGAGYGVHADIKDDATVAQQVGALFDAWGLPGFDAPAEPPAGPARCTAVLAAARDWAAARGHEMVELDNDDDAWHALLVPEAWLAEWQALSVALGVRTRTGAQAFAD
jgi:Domain of unknown function (DUF1911)